MRIIEEEQLDLNNQIKQKQNNIENNICPRCGKPLVLRKNKNGDIFYGCSNYPDCTFTKKI